MEVKKIWMTGMAAVCLMLVLLSAACGKTATDTPKSSGTGESGQETDGITEKEGTGTDGNPAKGGSNPAGDTSMLAGGGSGTLLYEVRRQERQYSAENGTPIFELKIAYPYFLEEEAGTANINQYWKAWVQQKLDGYEAEENSTRQAALEVYRESRDSAWAGPWSESWEPVFVKTWNGYGSVLMDSYLYEGGNHSTPYREGMVFRLLDGQEAVLSELTGIPQTGTDEQLRIRFAKVVSEGEEGEYFEDADEILQKMDMGDIGYYLTDTGIRFYLPPYEIGPYSTGYVETEIPYSKFE